MAEAPLSSHAPCARRNDWSSRGKHGPGYTTGITSCLIASWWRTECTVPLFPVNADFKRFFWLEHHITQSGLLFRHSRGQGQFGRDSKSRRTTHVYVPVPLITAKVISEVVSEFCGFWHLSALAQRSFTVCALVSRMVRSQPLRPSWVGSLVSADAYHSLATRRTIAQATPRCRQWFTVSIGKGCITPDASKILCPRCAIS